MENRVWIKRAAAFLALSLAFWYGHYCGKTNADHWWKEQPPLRHALIVRPQPSGYISEPCALIVPAASVTTILPDGTYALNQTAGQIRNCAFQWVEVH